LFGKKHFKINRIHTVARAYPIIYAGIVERAYLIIHWAGISGYDVIDGRHPFERYMGGGGGETYLLIACPWTILISPAFFSINTLEYIFGYSADRQICTQTHT
jgi:hypothetical protein